MGAVRLVSIEQCRADYRATIEGECLAGACTPFQSEDDIADDAIANSAVAGDPHPDRALANIKRTRQGALAAEQFGGLYQPCAARTFGIVVLHDHRHLWKRRARLAGAWVMTGCAAAHRAWARPAMPKVQGLIFIADLPRLALAASLLLPGQACPAATSVRGVDYVASSLPASRRASRRRMNRTRAGRRRS